MGQIDASAQQQAVTSSSLQATYGQAVDRESAYEKLAAKLAPAGDDKPATKDAPKEEHHGGGKAAAAGGGVLGGLLGSSAFKSFARSAASALGREITRGVFGVRKRR
jgi:hypothetical protein